jgi:hypothetical protein
MGTFDGGNHSVTNMNIEAVSNNGQGLFGHIYNSTIRNIHVSGTINAAGTSNVGGVVGRFDGGLIENAHSSVNVTGNGSTGGLVGTLQNTTEPSTIRNSSATGNVSGSANAVGGLVGSVNVNNAFVEHSFATGNVTNTGGQMTGGVVGLIGSGAIVQNVFATGSVSSNSASVGGVAGHRQGTSLLQNSAALNPSITGPSGSTTVGRVVGNALGTAANLTNNIAFAGMTGNITADPTVPANTGLAHRNGESVTTDWIHANGTLGGRFATPAWTTANGSLPGFGTAQAMPAHIMPTMLSPFHGEGTAASPFLISTAERPCTFGNPCKCREHDLQRRTF